MSLPLSEIVHDFAAAFKAVDETRPVGTSRTRTYQAGIGPLTEDEAVKKALEYLRTSSRAIHYAAASPKPYPKTRLKCDLLIPGAWAIEFKLLRPFGDNGKEAEHWSENIIHPYRGHISSIGDCFKLLESGFSEPKAVIVFGYEHKPAMIPLEPAVRSFEVIAREVHRLILSSRIQAAFEDLVHPVHQRGLVIGWEIQGVTPAERSDAHQHSEASSEVR